MTISGTYQGSTILDGGVEGWIFTTALSGKCYREAARAEATSVVEPSTCCFSAHMRICC